jgi:ribitol-5-phosphate 2-dehydrogenase (NADP+)
MINFVYRLVAPRQIRVDYIENYLSNDLVVVRPTYMSICAADQRYYMGNRDKSILAQKLPMALIHEAVGQVVYDPTGHFAINENVVMVPNTPLEEDSVIKENYLKSSRFRASGFDGFMQNLVFLDPNCVVSIGSMNPSIGPLLELMSVCLNAVQRFEECSHSRKDTLGIWGDGSLGYLLSLILKQKYPQSKIVVFGKRKLERFSFADKVFHVDMIPNNVSIDHGFECVGGMKSETAINQMIELIQPQGSMVLLGVSEDKVSIQTRLILEKGLIMVGNSRSGRDDFIQAVQLVKDNPSLSHQLERIITQQITIRDIEDIHTAFDNDINTSYKTIMKWEI